jgi:hypothetical protein
MDTVTSSISASRLRLRSGAASAPFLIDVRRLQTFESVELTPQSPGLLTASLGLSVNHPDDHAMLEQGMMIYDAHYAWARSARAKVQNADPFRKQP